MHVLMPLVLKKVNFKMLTLKLFLIIDLLLCAKLFELLAINHSSSENRIVFVPWLLKFSYVLGVHCSCSIVPNGYVSLVVSFNIHQDLKC